jgi:hypothetical protein
MLGSLTKLTNEHHNPPPCCGVCGNYKGRTRKGRREHDAAAKCANLFGVDLHPNKLLDSHLVTRIALISGGRDCGFTAGNCKFLKAKPDNMYVERKI